MAARNDHQARAYQERRKASRAERIAEIERQRASGELTIRKASRAEREGWQREREQREQRARTVSALVDAEPEGES